MTHDDDSPEAIRERALARMIPREELTPEHEAVVAEMVEANRDKIAAVRAMFAPRAPRVYQLDPVWGDDHHEVYPVPPDTQLGDVMLIATGDVTFYRVATADEPRDPVDIWRPIGEGPGHWLLETPAGWERTPTVDGVHPLADQGFQ